ncbi:group III truncated hemoglobin [Novosphingobium sp.]|uniref:group III truncated hemoglobin n=1 Tax=Novosphingobium sp. TaxID=1874826 RepID=UPI0035B0DD20
MTDPQQPRRMTKQGHPHALAARQRKRADAAAIGVDEDYIDSFVEAFYARIRDDALLGPIFAERIADWGPHLARMKAFWRSVLLNSGEYSGNPMRMHHGIPGLEEAHFVHWLELFYATLHELGKTAEARGEVGGRARMIADSLLTGIAMQRTGDLSAARAGQNLPRIA